MGLDHTIDTRHYSMADGVIAIPPADEEEASTRITIRLRNPQNYDLTFAAEGDGYEHASAALNGDKQAVTVTIENQARLSDFDLTLNMSVDGRPMTPYKLPKMQSRYFGNDLENISVTLPADYASYATPPLVFDGRTDYTVDFDKGIEKIVIEAVLPPLPSEPHTTVMINGQGNPATIQVLQADQNPVYIKVLADCGMEKTYSITLMEKGAVALRASGSINYYHQTLEDAFINAADGDTITVLGFINREYL